MICVGITVVTLAVTLLVRTQLQGREVDGDRITPAQSNTAAALVAQGAAPSPAAIESTLSADLPKDLPAAAAQQTAAANEIKKQPVVKPITGEIKERPVFVSEMEWEMLKAVSQQHASPEKELTRMVNFLRFTKQLELWESMPKSEDAAKRQIVANELLEDLPNRVRNGELELADAQGKMRALVQDAESNDKDRARRMAAENTRLSAVGKKL
ncbi:MAG: hypothetical protein EPO09_03950 [Aquabacterium sp.]|uniref:hypothetical protein n=1 Tax=Aquabacterium sp. TaxID=1872578 RepID=UPI00121917D5|nr:hypothetical protein [Aquabacterium sp.]TAK97475.1 MAG: hypothetical protein EPO09_03950 [Aquabacterium sp.]